MASLLRKNRLALAVGTIVLLPVVLLAGMSLLSGPPEDLGVFEGRLRPCPDSPNCVGTNAESEIHRMAAIPFDGEPSAAIDRIKRVIGEMPRSRLVTERPDYLHVEFTSRLFRFVDDVEFLIDDQAKLIHFRSASRVGRSDLGVNRERMNQIRLAFNADD